MEFHKLSKERGNSEFDTKRRNHEVLRLEGFSRYDLESESIFKFLLIFKIRFWMQYECMMPCNMLALYIPRQKKKVPNIYGICIVGGKVALIPVVSSNETILHNCG
jgi:hypothetical protein